MIMLEKKAFVIYAAAYDVKSFIPN